MTNESKPVDFAGCITALKAYSEEFDKFQKASWAALNVMLGMTTALESLREPLMALCGLEDEELDKLGAAAEPERTAETNAAFMPEPETPEPGPVNPIVEAISAPAPEDVRPIPETFPEPYPAPAPEPEAEAKPPRADRANGAEKKRIAERLDAYYEATGRSGLVNVSSASKGKLSMDVLRMMMGRGKFSIGDWRALDKALDAAEAGK